MTITESFFVAGGTVPPGSPSYVERAADRELYDALLSGEYCYVLNSRQMGKSSLAVRTVSRLQEAGVRTAFVDLTRIGGANVSHEQWYAGLLAETGRVLELRTQAVSYLREHKELGAAQRYLGFLQEVALPAASTALVVMIDEIDAVRSLSFSTDELFAGIRQLHNGRASDPSLSNLTFCLLGAALPSDLIRDARTTPFNVGRRIELRDFSRHEAAPLAKALRSESELERVLFWTGGHPFLTQTLCSELGSSPGVDALVRERYLDARARETDTNLADVGRRLLSEGDPNVGDEERADTLSLYEKLMKGGIPDDESNPSCARIKMSGVARLENGRLGIRNRIYAEVFHRGWVRENMPGQELRRQKQAFWKGALRTAAIAGSVLAVIGALALNNARLRRIAEEGERSARREEYFSAMNSIFVSWEERNFEQIRRVLDRERDYPGRGWEWAFWNHRIGGDGPTIDVSATLGPRLSPDGKTFAIRRPDRIKICDPHTLKVLREFPAPGRSSYLCWADNDSLVTQTLAAAGHMVEMDAHSGKIRKDYGELFASRRLHGGASPDGRFIFATTPAHNAVLVERSSGRVIPISIGIDAEDGEFTPDGKRLVLLVPHLRDRSRFAVVQLEVTSGREVGPRIGGESLAGTLAISPDGKRVCVASAQSNIRLFDLASAEPISDPIHTEGVVSIAFSSDGKRIAFTDSNRIGSVYDVSARRLRLIQRVDSVNVINFLPGSHEMIASYNIARLVDADSGTTERRQLPVGAYNACLTEDRAISLKLNGPSRNYWEVGLRDDRPAHVIDRVFTRAGLSNFDPVGPIVERGAMVLRDILRQREIGKFPLPSSDFFFDVSPDGQRLAVVSGRDLSVWNTATRERIGQATIAERRGSLRFSPDSQALAVGLFSGTVELRRLDRDLTPIWTKMVHDSVLSLMSFGADGKWIATGSDDDTGAVIDVRSGKVISRLVGHGQTVIQTVVSPDKTRVATCSFDGTVRLWEPLSGREITTLERGDTMWAIRYSKDGSSLNGIGHSGRVYQWTFGHGGSH